MENTKQQIEEEKILYYTRGGYFEYMGEGIQKAKQDGDLKLARQIKDYFLEKKLK